MKKIIGVWMLVITLVVTSATPIMAYEEKEHNEYLELVLFGDENYKKSLPKTDDRRKAIEALEAASYLCIDQYNGNGQDNLNKLRDYGIRGLPKNVKDENWIDFKGNYTHRQYTHKGWNYAYPLEDGKLRDKANWPKRKKLLRKTVNKIFQTDNMIQKLYKNVIALFSDNTIEDKQYDSFCSMIYYIHILGDQLDRKRYEESFTIVSFIELPGRGEYNIVDELFTDFENLFSSQINKNEYMEFIRKLKTLKMEADRYSDNGGLYIPDNFKEYKKYEKEFMDTMGEYVPKLLKNEDFFKSVFY